MSLEEIKSAEDQIQKLPWVRPEKIQLGFFSKTRSSIIDLDSEASDKKYSLDENGLEYRFSEPVYLSKLEVESAYADPVEIGFEFMTLNNPNFVELPGGINQDEEYISECIVGKFVAAFRIRSKRKGFLRTKEQVVKIRANILPIDELDETSELVKRYLEIEAKGSQELELGRTQLAKSIAENEIKIEKALASEQIRIAEIARKESEAAVHLAKLSAEIEAGQRKLAEVTQALESAELTRNETEAEVDTLSTRAEEFNRQIEADSKLLETLKYRLKDQEAEFDLKAAKIASQNDRLQSLQNDISMYSEDIAGLTRMGEDQKKEHAPYIWTAILTAAAVVGFSGYSAQELYVDFVNGSGLSFTVMLGLKLFFLVSAGACLWYLHRLVMPFIEENKEINRERRTLLRVSSIARDTSEAVFYGSSLSPQERQKYTAAQKIAFAREYLSGEYDQSHKQSKAPRKEREAANAPLSLVERSAQRVASVNQTEGSA